MNNEKIPIIAIRIHFNKKEVRQLLGSNITVRFDHIGLSFESKIDEKPKK